MSLGAYSKWTARVALIVLALVFVVAIALIPVHTSKGGAGAVWPLSEHFGHRHVIADIELFFGWLILGVGALISFGFLVAGLLRRAEWRK